MLDTSHGNHQTAQADIPVEFQNVDFSINGRKLIFNICCRIEGGGKTIIMGPNGAGKSLFLRLLAGLLEPDSGQVVINGGYMASGGISMVFQNPVLLRRSAFANIAYVLRSQDHSKSSIAPMVDQALALAQLEKHADKPARLMSGGEQQRLALARALVVNPAILLLDEATASLDPASTFIVEKMVEKVAREGTKVIFITHDVRQAKRIGDDIVFIHEGRMLTHKTATDFFRDPGSNEAQAYLDGRVPGQLLQE